MTLDMNRHRDLWYTISGQIMSAQELLAYDSAAYTPLHAIDSIYDAELFCNPWGSASEFALSQTLAQVTARASRPARPSISLQRAVDVISMLQAHLESEAARGIASSLISTLIDLKGYPLSEIRDSVEALGRMVHDFQTDRLTLRAMLGGENPSRFFTTHRVIRKFGLISSGNLGLFEIAVLVWTGILAQAAANGTQFSLIIKPSIYDFLFHELIHLIPDDARHAFSRLTWRSEADIIPDSRLMAKLVNEVEGAIFFGNRRTLSGFRALIQHDTENHRFYHDHFPVMVVLPGASPECVVAAAKLAVTLAYKSKGEACLSLQDVFAHVSVYDSFVAATIQEWRRLRQARGDPRSPDSLLPSYSVAHLEQISNLRCRMDGAIVGQIHPEQRQTDLIINHELDLDNWILSTENAAPLLCIAAFTEPARLPGALEIHLDRSTSDKFIYSLIVSGESEEPFEMLYKGLESLSHRLDIRNSASALNDFQAYVPGIPHCGGISFLADMFGLPHRPSCYVG